MDLIEFSTHVTSSQGLAALGAAGLPFLILGWRTPILILGIGLPLAYLAAHLTNGKRAL